MKKILGFCVAAGVLLSSVAAQAVEIEYWQYLYKARVTAVDALIEKFEAKNPDIKVIHKQFPYADYRTKVAAAIPAGEGPDVVQLFYGWLNDYIDAGLIQPLSTADFPVAEIDKNFFPMVQAMKRDGQYYALPTAVRSLALFWNKRLFEEAGLDASKPPQNLDELIEFAKKLTKTDGGGNITQVGITMGMAAQDHHWWREVLVRQFGGQPYEGGNKSIAYNSEAGKKALQFYTDLQTKHKVSSIGFMDQPQAAFKASRAAMHIDGSFRIGSLRKIRGLKWGVGELPANDKGERFNFSSYWVNAITSKAKGERAVAAAKFLAFMTSDEAMQLWLDVVGELPAKPSVALIDKNTTHPEYGPFIKGLSYANATKFVNESAQRQAMMNMVDRIVLKGQSIGDSLGEAAAEEQKLLDTFHAK